MTCPYCRSCQTRKLNVATDLGYARFQCRTCQRTFNERTGTPFNFLEMPTDIVFQVVLFRWLLKLSLRDLMYLFLIRGMSLVSPSGMVETPRLPTKHGWCHVVACGITVWARTRRAT